MPWKFHFEYHDWILLFLKQDHIRWVQWICFLNNLHLFWKPSILIFPLMVMHSIDLHSISFSLKKRVQNSFVSQILIFVLWHKMIEAQFTFPVITIHLESGHWHIFPRLSHICLCLYPTDLLRQNVDICRSHTNESTVSSQKQKSIILKTHWNEMRFFKALDCVLWERILL